MAALLPLWFLEPAWITYTSWLYIHNLLLLSFLKTVFIQIDAWTSFHVCDKVLNWEFCLLVLVLPPLNKGRQLEQLLLTKSNMFNWQLHLQDFVSSLIFPLYLHFFLFLLKNKDRQLQWRGQRTRHLKILWLLKKKGDKDRQLRTCFSLSQMHLPDYYLYKKNWAFTCSPVPFSNISLLELIFEEYFWVYTLTDCGILGCAGVQILWRGT